jgi:sugar/nucleoside kinase (ribokinase family)
MTDSTPDIISAGHLCLDMFPRFTDRETQKPADIFRPGALVKTGDMTFATGGSVSNTGMAMKMFGCNVGYVAKVGDDAIGSIIIEILKQRGNPEGIRIAKGEPSSYTVVLAPAGVDRIFLHCPGTNDTFVSNDIDFSLVSNASLFHFGYPSLMDAIHANQGHELALIMSRAKETDATTSLDMSLPDPNSPAGRADWPAIYANSLKYVDIFVPSIEEAFFTLFRDRYAERKAACEGSELTDHITPDEFAETASTFIDMGCAVVALKAGHNGWYLKTAGANRLAAAGRLAPADADAWADREYWCPAFKVESIASATGSGDTSIAAFLTSLHMERKPVQCLKMANCAGCMNLRAMDALSGLASWNEMEKALPDLTVRDIPALHNTDWQWNQQQAVWER